MPAPSSPPPLSSSGITAIVPTYNYARFLPQALDSLIGQTVPFDRIIVVDDGSTDGTREVLGRYEGRIEAVSIANGGQLGACVEGLRRARSEYVYFLDADDYASPELNEVLLEHLRDGPDKLQFQLQGVGADEGGGGRTLSVFPAYAPGYGSAEARADNAALGFYVSPPTSGNVYRRSVLEKLDFSVLSPRDFIDGTPNLVIPYLGSMKSLNRPLAYYRVHGQSHSQTGDLQAKLQREMTMFDDRWEEARKLLGWDAPPFGEALPAFALQRRMMRAALEGRASRPQVVLDYTRRILASHLARRQKALLAGWALSFLVPVAALRRYAVEARHSVSSRPRLLQRVLGRLLQS